MTYLTFLMMPNIVRAVGGGAGLRRSILALHVYYTTMLCSLQAKGRCFGHGRDKRFVTQSGVCDVTRMCFVITLEDKM